MKDGRIVARQITLYVDAGAYSRHSPYGTTKAAAHMPGPYTIPNVHVDAHCVYTNRTPSSAMRGFGVTIGDFALEVQMDKLARLLGMDPIEFRIKNAYRDGDMKAHGEIDARRRAGRDDAGGGEARRLAALRRAAMKASSTERSVDEQGATDAPRRAGAASPRSTIRPA